MELMYWGAIKFSYSMYFYEIRVLFIRAPNILSKVYIGTLGIRFSKHVQFYLHVASCKYTNQHYQRQSQTKTFEMVSGF